MGILAEDTFIKLPENITQCVQCGQFTTDGTEPGHFETCPLYKPETKSIEGTYTIQGRTKHVTIRFHQTHWLKRLIADGRQKEGVLVVGWLRGADNSNDYTGFAFAVPTSQGYRLFIWTKVDQEKYKHQIWSALRLLSLFNSDPEGLAEHRYAYALMSGNCSRCHRKLTVPASIHKGLGPECTKIVSK